VAKTQEPGKKANYNCKWWVKKSLPHDAQESTEERGGRGVSGREIHFCNS